MNATLRSLISGRSSAIGRRRRAKRCAFQPRIETLESRHLLTTFIVNTTLDEPAADDTAMDGYISLREAVRAASDDRKFGDAPPGQADDVDRILFSPALTGMTIELQGEQLTIAGDLVLEGLGQDELTVSAGGLSRVFTIAGGANVEISDISVTHGNAHTHIYEGAAGAVLNFGSLSIRDTRLRMNDGWFAGGVVLNLGTLDILTSTLENNTATEGGAIANFGVMTVRESVLRNNEATGSGGAISNELFGNVILDDTVVSQNTAADYGGGIFTNRGTLTVTGSEFSDNSAVRGGGVGNQDSAVTIDSSTFRGNTATFYGGGVFTDSNYGGASLNINNSTLSDNHAGRGGGVYSIFSDIKIINSTISENTALRDGGGIHNLGPLLVNHSTITGNRADADGNDAIPEGGGIMDFQPRAIINNSIVAGNFHGIGDEPDDIGNLIDSSSSFNLIGDAATAGGLTHGVNGNIVGNAGSGVIDVASVLDPQLADNGGATLTHALVAGSPAIDAADSSLQYDQRGSRRMLDGDDDGHAASDIGAYELVTLTSLVAPLQDKLAELKTGGLLSQGEATRLSRFLALAQRRVEDGRLDQGMHFLGLFIDHVERVADSEKLSAPTASALTSATSSIFNYLEEASDEHRTFDELFANYVFDWCLDD